MKETLFNFRTKGDNKSNNGRKYERKVVRNLKLHGIKIISTNKDVYINNRRVTDIDVETEYANIEVKTSSNKSKIGKQLRTYKQISSKEPIGMAPNLNNRERKKLNDDGFNVFSSIKYLIKYLKNKNKNPNCVKIIYNPKREKKRKKYGR